MEEDIKVIEEQIEYDKEHRIVTVFDKQPLFRDRLENLVKGYRQLEEENKQLRSLLRHYRLLVYSRFGKDAKGK